MPFSPGNGIDDIVCSFMLFSPENRIIYSSMLFSPENSINRIVYAVYWLASYAVFEKPHNASELQILFRILMRCHNIIVALLF